jgi:GntP family gluconate:H+ symporter
MSIPPFAVLVLGTAAVLGGILVLRLHAFLALVLGALLVACLTPQQALFDQSLRDSARTVSGITQQGLVEFGDDTETPLEPGLYYLFRYDARTGRLRELGTLEQIATDGKSTVGFQMHGTGETIQPQKGDLVATPSERSAALGAANASVGQRLAEGFGSTCASIGLLIAMASIIGKCLLESGSAEQIVLSIRRLCGDRLTPLAFAVSSFIVAIPVFFDTVFFLMIPLARAMAAKTGKNYLLYVLSIVAGGTIAHSLVPPTPGPLFVASEFGVSVGLMILGGAVVAATGVVCVFPYLLWANRRWTIPLRDTAAAPEAERSPSDLPPFWLAMLPIALPVVLIAGRTILEMSGSLAADSSRLRATIEFVGDKNIALVLAAAIALVTLWMRWTGDRGQLRTTVQEALSAAGVIILITAAGGAFGSVLRSTGIATSLMDWLPQSESGIPLLLLAFGLTALIRVAQGSATVAMIASAGIIAPLAATIQLPYHPLYLALAIGSGSKPLPWMNDSGFWIVCKMSGFTEAETLKTFSVVLTIMGFACLAATIVGALLFPLV